MPRQILLRVVFRVRRRLHGIPRTIVVLRPAVRRFLVDVAVRARINIAARSLDSPRAVAAGTADAGALRTGARREAARGALRVALMLRVNGLVCAAECARAPAAVLVVVLIR